MNISKGFSLIEVMIAISIIAVIGAVTTTIVTRTYRTTSQSADVSKLKENGERAINSIAEGIRMADKVVCYGSGVSTSEQLYCANYPGTRTNSIVIRTIAGKYVKYSFVDPVMTFPYCNVTQNGYIIKQENLNPSDVGNDEESFCTTTLSAPAPIAISNNDTLTGVSIRNGEFKKLSGSNNKDTITISFYTNLSQSLGKVDSADTAYMQTTVQVR